MSKQQHLVALGGGGFSMTPDNPLLDAYVFALSGKKRPLVCFVPTASGDAETYIGNFYQAMAKHHPQVRATHLALFRQKGSLEEQLSKADVIYVGGGNTFNMLTLWRAWGVDALLHRAYKKGTVIAGISAGANCWFETFLTDSTGQLTLMPGLGWIKGAYSPHYDGEKKRRPALHKLLPAARTTAYACDNDAAVHFVNGQFHKAISARKNAQTYSVDPVGRKVRERKMQSLLLS